MMLDATHSHMGDESQKVEALAQRFSRTFSQDGLVLYGGANLPGPRASAMLGLPLGAMPAMGHGTLRDQPGVADIAEIESLAEGLACRLFKGDWAEVRLQSCTLANLAAYAAICQPVATIAVTPRAAGGHLSHQSTGAPGMLRLNVVELPFDDRTQGIDDIAAAKAIRAQRPKLVMLGASLVTHAYEFDHIRAAATEVGAAVGYDVAHIAGLVAGGAFPNPLQQGADFLTLSTYKSLGGPPGGIIVGGSSGDELHSNIRAAVFPWMTANYDASRVAALAISLEDFEIYGRDYVDAMLDNARILRKTLVREGIVVAPSETHLLALPLADAHTAMKHLECCGILCGTIRMRGQDHASGLRVGTQLLTRRGFDASDMVTIGVLLSRCLKGDSPESVQREVRALSRSRKGLIYCQSAR